MSSAKFNGIIISYMGNTNGRDEENENRLKYVKQTLSSGLHVCINVVFKSGAFLLPCGADEYEVVPPVILSHHHVWCNAIDTYTLEALCDLNAHCFFMGSGACTLTSNQFIWSLPGVALTDRSIAAFPELAEDMNWLATAEPAGLCTNFPAQYT
jgi:hypothetical protein